MGETYLKALGLHADWGATAEALQHAKQMAVDPPDPYSHISVYNDPSGACVGLIDTRDGFSTETFTVHGAGGHTVEAWQVMPGTAEINLLDDDGELITRFLAFVDDPHMYPWYPLKAVAGLARYSDYQLGAIAVDVNVYDSVEAWKAEQEPLNDAGMRIGPTFIASPWLFALYAGDATAEEASPVSMFKAVVKHVNVVTNRLTGVQWYRALADCGFECALALPMDTTPAPRVGSVVDGKAFLTGTTGFWGSAVQ
ncbi:hypothetical protein [Actinomyces sp. MRS3W]|uniref:hypothetical protein n=1 Tax=Actinomyces sp. MRS3W TaxID=2800796 RepID=UPI0028FD4D18|nr:hypothetical protein [Actinomyces sp. MRS3W]MDU0347679.1 hypothetical protein [Actinomyces sp. MRS3W]